MAGTLIAGTIGDGSKSASVSKMIDSRIEARVSWDGSVSERTILESTNVSSVVDSGTGMHTINFSKPISTQFYTITGMAQRSTTGSDVLMSIKSGTSITMTTTSATVITFGSGGTAIGVNYASVAVIV